jgi:hypothetical protein
VNWKVADKKVSRGQTGLDRRDLRGGVTDTSITWVWQENGYGHVMLPETAISNAAILRQYGNDIISPALLAGSDAPLCQCRPSASELNRFFQVRPAPMSL